jgi:signal transduction histidine kinase
VTRPLPRTIVAVVAVGIACAAVVAALGDVPAHDAVVLLAITGAASVAAATVGAVVSHHGRARSLRTQVVLVGATAAAVVVVGLTAAAEAMFISTHDRNVLYVVVTMATSTALAAALALASSFDRDAAAIRRLTSRLGEERALDPPTFRISEMEALARALTEANARLDRARARELAVERSRRELVAWISHDLRSPLASIRALAEALEDGIVAEPGDVERYHRSIRVESERLSALVDDLFELSRLQASAPRHEDAGTVPLGDLVHDAVAGIDAVAGFKGVGLDVEVAAVASFEVPATDVLRIVRNLLDNAVRHTPAGGTIRIEGRRDDHSVLLSVSDECGGIPEHDLPRVFDVAFRGDAARSRNGSGGGLGLTIAKGLVEAHDGSIDVRNLDAGCRFRVRIPVTDPSEPADPANSANSANSRSGE